MVSKYVSRWYQLFGKTRVFLWPIMAFTMITVAGSLVTFLGDGDALFRNQRLYELQQPPSVTQGKIEALTNETEALRRSIENITAKAPITDAVLQAKLAKIDQIQSELDELKGIIIQDPAKALALPLMRKDMAEIEKRQDALSVSVDVQIGRIYDFSKWFLALMITLAIGLVTMGFVKNTKPTS